MKGEERLQGAVLVKALVEAVSSVEVDVDKSRIDDLPSRVVPRPDTDTQTHRL